MWSIETPSTAGLPPNVAVVIVSWNVRELLLACLDSLANSDTKCRIVVVDNASTDGSAEALATRADVECVGNLSNVGFTRANNQALRHLGVIDSPDVTDAQDVIDTPDTVVLLNPDTTVAPDAITVLAGHLAAHPKVAAVGPALFWPDGSPQPSRRRFPSLGAMLFESTPLEWHWRGNPFAKRYRMSGLPAATGPVDWLSGAALAFRSTALREAAGFDEQFFMYSEETDLCKRLVDAGWAIHFVPEARVVHHEGKSSEQNVAARHIEFQRSRVRYAAKHLGRLRAQIVRGGVLAAFALEAGLEAAKLAVGNQPELRRARISMYRAILADRLTVSAGR